MTEKPFIHPATPARLVKKFKKVNYKYHKLAEEELSDETFEVNVKYVYELIHDGKEPNDTTATLREVRHRLCLRKYKRKNQNHQVKPEPAEEIIWWRRIGKERRNAHIRLGYEMDSKGT